eukprot:4560270-Pleurochrysis_carterae.AAC.3
MPSARHVVLRTQVASILIQDGTKLERSINLDNADTAPHPQPGDPTPLHQEENPKPKRTATSLAIGGCSKEKLSKLAKDFMEVVGEHLRSVCGDGSCWPYSVLGAFGVLEYTGVQVDETSSNL